MWETIRHSLVTPRETEGREAGPTAVIIDTQSVKTTEKGGPRGDDAAKKVKGRQRHIGVDTSAFCLVSSSTPLIFRTPTAPGIC